MVLLYNGGIEIMAVLTIKYFTIIFRGTIVSA